MFVMRQVFGCPRCGFPTTAGQRFCGRCGCALSTDCPRCGTFISPGERFCENCGAAAITGPPQQQIFSPPQVIQRGSQTGYPTTEYSTTYPPVQSANATSLAVSVPKSTSRVSAVLLLIASIMLIVSPSLVWFRSQTTVLGLSMPAIAVKGSELGDVSSLLSFVGTSLIARGEYIIVLGAVALILTIISFFVLKGRKMIAAIIGVAAVICILLGVEATMKLMDASTTLSEGIFLMFGSALLLLIGSFKLP